LSDASPGGELEKLAGLPKSAGEIKYPEWTKTNKRAMKKTFQNKSTPGGRSNTSENPSSKEADPTDSGEGQLLLDKRLTQRSTSFSIARSKKVNLEEIKTLKQEIKLLRYEIKQLKIAMNKVQEEICRLTGELSKQKISTYYEQEYHISDEELARETDWILKREKKRKAKQSLETINLEKNTIERKPELDVSKTD